MIHPHPAALRRWRRRRYTLFTLRETHTRLATFCSMQCTACTACMLFSRVPISSRPRQATWDICLRTVCARTLLQLAGVQHPTHGHSSKPTLGTSKDGISKPGIFGPSTYSNELGQTGSKQESLAEAVVCGSVHPSWGSCSSWARGRRCLRST